MCRNSIATQKNPVVVRETAYVDNVFLAKNVKCPVYTSTGLIDHTCIATSVFAYYNALPLTVEKHIHVNPVGGHNGSGSIDGPDAVDAILGLKE